MDKLIQQIDQAIERYRRFSNNYLVADLIQKMEGHKKQLETYDNRAA